MTSSSEPPIRLSTGTPRASAERIKLFLDAFGTRPFRHADELVPIMRRDDATESRISCREMRLDDELRGIYQVRAKHLAKSAPSPHYPPGLADDVCALADRLDAAADQKMRIWNTLLRSGTTYSVFELMDDDDLAGCVKSADQRIVNPRPW